MFKTFYSTSDWQNDPFSFNIGCSESKVILKRRKKANTSNKNALQGANVRTSCISLRTPATNQQQTNTVNTQKSPHWACDKGCAEACAERFSALNFAPLSIWTLGTGYYLNACNTLSRTACPRYANLQNADDAHTNRTRLSVLVSSWSDNFFLIFPSFILWDTRNQLERGLFLEARERVFKTKARRRNPVSCKRQRFPKRTLST